MSLSFLAPQKTVLMISDDGVHVYSGSEKITTVFWGDENFQKDLTDVIVNKCKKRPVLFLNDMVEQHYRKEKVPRVGVFDRANMIKRKLAISFPNYPVRAALPLKEKSDAPANSNIKIKADNYIFAAIPPSEHFQSSLKAVQESLCSISGYVLLPVEASSMVSTLSEKVLRAETAKNKEKEKRKAKWCVFIGHHEGGGLRQIVTRNGELALTRMSPIVASQDDPAAWAREVMQEFRSTMSYVSRFGYRSDDGLHVMAIGDDNAAPALEELMNEDCYFTVLKVSEAAKTLGLKLPKITNEAKADCLHVAWVSSRSKYILPMQSREVDRISKPRQIAVFAIVLLGLASLPQMYQIFDYQTQVSELESNVENQRQRSQVLQDEMAKELEKQREAGIDFLVIQAALSLYDNLNDNDIGLIRFMYEIGKALPETRRIDSFEISKKEQSALQMNNFWGQSQGLSIGGEQLDHPGFEMRMQMTYPTDIDVDRGNEEIELIAKRMRIAFPQYDVRIEKFLKDYRFVEELVVGREESLPQDFLASFLITGPNDDN